LPVFAVPALVCFLRAVFGSDEGAQASGGFPFLKALQYVLRCAYFSVFFYFALNLYYHLIVGRRKLPAFFQVTGLLILASFAFHSLLYAVFPGALMGQYDSLPDLLCSCMQAMIPMLVISFLFAYVTNIREALVQRRVLEAQKLQLEMEKAQANFNFLKAQINPHFLHNTLNFLYSKSLPYSAELSEGILTLSDIMRYSLSEGNQRDGKASLTDEVEHVNNVIKINQLRFENQLQVQFKVQGNLNGVSIVPFVLITLVENAFKHGDLRDAEHPIDIQLTVTENQIHFICGNKKKNGPKPLSTGIGLENIKKRLDLAYGDQYRFVIQDEPEYYTADLTINTKV
jgi:hypothetical protein